MKKIEEMANVLEWMKSNNIKPEEWGPEKIAIELAAALMEYDVIGACKRLHEDTCPKELIYALVKEVWPGSVDTLDEVAQEVFGDSMYVSSEE